jgi:hypothetical protein
LFDGIRENIIVAQEMTHSMVKIKGIRCYFAIKVYLSKAYDKLKTGTLFGDFLRKYSFLRI